MEVEFRSGNFSQLTNAHLYTLLKWHNVQKDQNNKKEFKLIHLCRIWEEQVEPPPFEWWTSEDESKLTALKMMKIDMSEKVAGKLE